MSTKWKGKEVMAREWNGDVFVQLTQQRHRSNRGARKYVVVAVDIEKDKTVKEITTRWLGLARYLFNREINK
jgi:hypothetical protein